VVASVPVYNWLSDTAQVSIPFIAGQWSLLLWDSSLNSWAMLSQSPSLRGSGRFIFPHITDATPFL